MSTFKIYLSKCHEKFLTMKSHSRSANKYPLVVKNLILMWANTTQNRRSDSFDTAIVSCSTPHVFADRLRTPNEDFFHRNPKLSGLGRQFGQINFVAFGVFSADLSAPILIQWVPCPCFPLINNHYFYKKTKPLYMVSKAQIFIWDWDLNLNLGRKELGI